jgi:hypothetical protein
LTRRCPRTSTNQNLFRVQVPSEPSESSATDRIDEDFLHQLEMVSFPFSFPSFRRKQSSNHHLLRYIRQLFADPDTYPDVQSRPIWSRIALTNVLAGPDTTETTISNLYVSIAFRSAFAFRLFRPCSRRTDSRCFVWLLRFRLRIHLPRVSFLFPGGPFRDFLVRLGYDPRKDPTSRLYAFQHSMRHLLHASSG